MDLKQIAEKWQEKRNTENIYKVVDYSPEDTKGDPKKPKFYILDMFPYPSGAGLHVGHPKGYIATDIIGRKKTLQGFNVLHPMGFDTFGLGTEQYAIEKKMKPQIIAQQNIDNFKRQLKMFGLTYDRDRSFSTAEPDYYKRTQRIFLQLYNHYYDEKLKKAMPIKNLKGSDAEIDAQRLAYVDFKPINRCPKCMTGLANEDLADGKCERCGTVVEQRPMKQRVLRITKYAERLLEGLDKLQRDEAMKDLERNRIGKSEGTQFAMQIASDSVIASNAKQSKSLKVLILHGFNGDCVENRFPRLKKELESQGIETLIPNLPGAGKPQLKEQLQFLEDNYKDLIDENMIIIGHSLGCFLANEFIIKCNKKIKKLINVAPVHEELTIDHDAVNSYFKGIKIDTKKLRKLIDKSIIVFLSRDDELIPYEEAKSYYEKYFKDSTIVSFEDKRHFNKKRGNVCELPEIMEYINSSSLDPRPSTLSFEVYTTRIDTVFGMSFVAMAPEHPLTDHITTPEHKEAVEKYKDEAKHKSQLERTELQKDKSGQFTGAYAINPFNNQKVPIYIADYVLAGYGTGVVMAVPAHDERDFEFAKKYKLVITNSILPTDKNHEEYKNILEGTFCYTEKGILNNSGDFTGLESDKAITEMQKRLEQNKIGGKKINYKIQDRVFSRQRYRGEPLPIVWTPDGKAIALDEKDLPLLLPDVENYEPTGTTEGPLANIDERVNITLPDGTKATRETNTMPGRAGSSRYRLRYMDPKNTKQLVSPEREKYRGEVDVYVGGAEHVTRHMIYARFWQKFLYDLGIVTHDEPFKEYHYVGLIMAEDGRKMSKRRGNTIDPDQVIGEFGHDTFRVYEMFMGPFDQAIARSTNGVKGAKKFLDKIVALQNKLSVETQNIASQATMTLLHQTIKKITDDIDGFKFNTCISQLMILVNHLTDLPSIDKKTFETLTILISPFAPHLAEELRSLLGNEFSIFTKAKWPSYDEKCLTSATIKIGVQFNGKVRGDICISKEAAQAEVMAIVKADAKLNARLTSEPKKIIYVPGKILNIVI